MTEIDKEQTFNNNWRVSFHYEGFLELPEGIPRTTMGTPLYPDPAIYPPDVISGYNGWIELTRVNNEWSYRWINPSAPRFRRSPTIRYGDFVGEIHNLLGTPVKLEPWPDANFRAEYHSDQVMVLYPKEGDATLGFYTFNSNDDSYLTWDFLFVEAPA
jgi:hypothetical protein